MLETRDRVFRVESDAHIASTVRRTQAASVDALSRLPHAATVRLSFPRLSDDESSRSPLDDTRPFPNSRCGGGAKKKNRGFPRRRMRALATAERAPRLVLVANKLDLLGDSSARLSRALFFSRRVDTYQEMEKNATGCARLGARAVGRVQRPTTVRDLRLFPLVFEEWLRKCRALDDRERAGKPRTVRVV